MKVILTGASGMIGGLLLDLCLKSSEVAEVISLVRRSAGNTDPKLTELIIEDFTNYTGIAQHLKSVDIAYFCIGVYTGSVKRDLFRKITVDYPVEFAKALHEHSPAARFCLLSGSGADRTEKSNMMFAKDKGVVENQLSSLGFKEFYAFRPSYIYPVTPRKEPNITYRISRLFYPLLKLLGKNASIKSTELASAMFNVGIKGYKNEIIENSEIKNIS